MRLGLCAGEPLVDDAADLRELVHQVRLRVEATGRVGDHEIRAAGHRGVERVVDDGPGIRPGRVRHDRDARPVGPDAELVDGSGTERIRGGQNHDLALGYVARRELADRGRLAGAVDADDQHDRRSALHRRPWRPVRVAPDEEGGQLRADRGLGSGRIPAGAGTLDDFHRQGRPDVARDQGLLDVVPGRTARTAEDAAQLRHEPAPRALQAGVDRAGRWRLRERDGVERGVGGRRLGFRGGGGCRGHGLRDGVGPRRHGHGIGLRDRLGFGLRGRRRHLARGDGRCRRGQGLRGGRGHGLGLRRGGGRRLQRDRACRILEVRRVGFPARFDLLGDDRRLRGGLLLFDRLVVTAAPEGHQPAGASSPRRPSASAVASSRRRLITRLTESSPTVTP